jgi:hypothetical protein
MFTGNYLSSTPRELRVPGVELELRSLISVAGTSAILYDYWCVGMEDRRRRRG